jgi:GST-like protein
MLDLYYWPTPNGCKVTILLHELNVRYNLLPLDIGKGDQFAKDFGRLNPNRRMPVVVDHAPADAGAPIALFESGAILMYLAEKHGRFWPQDVRTKFEVTKWVMWQMAGLGPMCGQAHHFRQYTTEPMPYAIERYTNEVHRLYSVMEERLADRPFLAGDFSIADIACWPWVKPYRLQGQDLERWPNLKRWFLAINERPGTRAGWRVGRDWLKGGPVVTEASKAVLFGQRGVAGETR